MRGLLLLCALTLACGDDDHGDATVDGSTADGSTADSSTADGSTADADSPFPAALPWPAELPSTDDLGARRGRILARAILHLHSPLSHDACDGEGWVTGEGLTDAQCLEHFRDGLCRARIDVAMLSDHAPHVNEVDFRQALWIRDGDEPLPNAETPYANRITCEGSEHRAVLTVGSENALMPLGFDRHPGDGTLDADALNALYDADDPVAIEAFRDAGALLWMAHTESKSVDYLRSLGLDGLELYNLHADVDPRIRSEFLGDSDAGYIALLLRFGQARYALAPDLALMTFLSRQQASLDKWDALTSEGWRIAGSGGCDAHENAFPMPLLDGERADSYRRMMTWITNHLLVDDRSPEAAEEALRAGRLYVVHEVLGTPVGFDFVAQDGEATFEMGEQAPLGATLLLRRPALPEGFPSDPPPKLSLHIFRADAAGAEEVASGDGESLTFTVDRPGAYRAEIRMIPHHTRPFLRSLADRADREQTWVYSNPIYVALPEPPMPDPTPTSARTPAAWRRAARRIGLRPPPPPATATAAPSLAR